MGQWRHVDIPANSANFPATQSLQSLAALATAVPPPWNLPSTHWPHSVAIGPAYVPAAHFVHSLVSTSCEKWPAAQLAQAAPWRYLPAVHCGVGLGVGKGVGAGVGIGVGGTVGTIVGAGVGAGVGDIVATVMECQHGVTVHDAPLRSSRQTQYVPEAASCSKLRHTCPTLEHCQPLHVSTAVPTSI